MSAYFILYHELCNLSTRLVTLDKIKPNLKENEALCEIYEDLVRIFKFISEEPYNITTNTVITNEVIAFRCCLNFIDKRTVHDHENLQFLVEMIDCISSIELFLTLQGKNLSWDSITISLNQIRKIYIKEN